MTSSLIPTFLFVRAVVATGLRRARIDERGEGVISAAIAVLVMAALGVAMWKAFDTMFAGAAEKTDTQIQQIGNE